MNSLYFDLSDAEMPDQPADGALICHCAHPLDGAYFWYSPAGLRFISPQGEQGETQWIMVCGRCFLFAEGELGRIQIAGHSAWPIAGRSLS